MANMGEPFLLEVTFRLDSNKHLFITYNDFEQLTKKKLFKVGL